MFCHIFIDFSKLHLWRMLYFEKSSFMEKFGWQMKKILFQVPFNPLLHGDSRTRNQIFGYYPTHHHYSLSKINCNSEKIIWIRTFHIKGNSVSIRAMSIFHIEKISSWIGWTNISHDKSGNVAILSFGMLHHLFSQISIMQILN